MYRQDNFNPELHHVEADYRFPFFLPFLAGLAVGPLIYGRPPFGYGPYPFYGPYPYSPYFY